MRPTLLLRAKHASSKATGAYQPMIRFLGQRKNIEHEPHAPAPHPAAPQEIKDTFQSFLSKLQSQSHPHQSTSSNPKGQSLDSSSEGKVLHHSEKDASPGTSSSSSSTGVSGGGGGGGTEKTSGPIASKPADYENFWDAPRYLWNVREMSELESEAVMSGGATQVYTRP